MSICPWCRAPVKGDMPKACGICLAGELLFYLGFVFLPLALLIGIPWLAWEWLR